MAQPINIPIIVTGENDLLDLERLFKKLGISGKKALDDIGDEAKRTSKKIGLLGKTGKFLKSGLGVLGVSAGAGLAVAGLKELVRLSSDVTEAMNLVKVTFGSAADSIIKASENSARAVNLSKGEFLGLSGEVGSLIKSFGFLDKDTAKISKQMIKLSADVGSFKNAKPEEVFTAIRAGIVGSSEPLLRFGTDVREANLRMRALKTGIIDTNRALTSQERTVAVLNEVMRSNADAMGDVERTRKDFAVGSKELFANLKTLGETVGTTLISVANDAVQFVNELFSDDILVASSTMVVNMGEFAAEMGKVADSAERAAGAIKSAAEVELDKLREEFRKDPFKFIDPEQQEDFAKQASDKVLPTFGELQEQFRQLEEDGVKAGLGITTAFSDVTSAAIVIKKETEKALEPLEDITIAPKVSKEDADSLNDSLNDMSDKVAIMYENGKLVTLTYEEQQEHIEQINELFKDQEKRTDEIAENEKKIKDISEDLANNTIPDLPIGANRLNKQLEKTGDLVLDAARSFERFVSAIDSGVFSLSSFFTLASLIPGPQQSLFQGLAIGTRSLGLQKGTDFVPYTGRYRVGEAGPEEVILPRGAQVIPNSQITNNESMNINLNFYGSANPNDVDDSMIDRIANKISIAVREGRSNLTASEVL